MNDAEPRSKEVGGKKRRGLGQKRGLLYEDEEVGRGPGWARASLEVSHAVTRAVIYRGGAVRPGDDEAPPRARVSDGRPRVAPAARTAARPVLEPVADGGGVGASEQVKDIVAPVLAAGRCPKAGQKALSDAVGPFGAEEADGAPVLAALPRGPPVPLEAPPPPPTLPARPLKFKPVAAAAADGPLPPPSSPLSRRRRGALVVVGAQQKAGVTPVPAAEVMHISVAGREILSPQPLDRVVATI